MRVFRIGKSDVDWNARTRQMGREVDRLADEINRLNYTITALTQIIQLADKVIDAYCECMSAEERQLIRAGYMRKDSEALTGARVALVQYVQAKEEVYDESSII